MKTRQMFKAVLLVLLGLKIFSIEQSAFGQSSSELKNEPILSIPFKFDGRILIPVKVKNSMELELILDSGFPQDNFLLLMHKELGDELNLDYVQSQNAARGGGSGEAKLVHLAVGIDVAFSHIDLGKMIVGVMDESREESPHHNKGVLGGAVFIPFVVKIDFDRFIIDLYTPDAFEIKEGWEEIPIILSERNLPMADLSFSIDATQNIKGRFLLDTGGLGNIIVLDEENQIKGPAETLHTLTGTGLRGDIFLDIGRVSNLKLGRYQLNNLISAIIPEKEVPEKLPALGKLGCTGLLGIEAMSRFNMIFDYSRKKLYIQPNKNYESLFEINMAGMVVKENTKGEFIVYHVIKGKEASKKGLKRGDKIYKIDGKLASKLTYSKLKRTFERDGVSVNIEVIRNGKTKITLLKLEKLI